MKETQHLDLTSKTQKALKELVLKKTSDLIELKKEGSIQAKVNSGKVPLILKPQAGNSPLVFTLVLNKMCDDLPTSALPCTSWTHFEDLKPSDESFNKTGPIDPANTLAKIFLPRTVPGQYYFWLYLNWQNAC